MGAITLGDGGRKGVYTGGVDASTVGATSLGTGERVGLVPFAKLPVLVAYAVVVRVPVVPFWVPVES